MISHTSLTVLSVLMSIVSIHTLKLTGVWILTRGVSELLRHALLPLGVCFRPINMRPKNTEVYKPKNLTYNDQEWYTEYLVLVAVPFMWVRLDEG